MKRFLLSCLLALAIPISLIAQKNPYVNATFYLASGEVLEGEVDSTFAKKRAFKVFYGDDSKEMTHFDVDSIHVGEDRYIIQHLKKKNYVKRYLEDGAVDLFQVNGKEMMIQSDSIHFEFVGKNYKKIYWFFCQERSEEKRPKMSEEDFISEVRSFNTTRGSQPWTAPNYQFEKSYIKPVIFRVTAAFVPSIAAEVKLSNSFSIYADLGINFFGDVARDAKTFVNPHSSAEIRYFFASASRLSQHKSIHNFTGHHIAVSFNYFMDSGVDNRQVVGFAYGWQANSIIRHGFARIRAGLGSDLKTADVYFLSGISLGWQF